MIKKYITKKNILYKPYLYFKIIWLEKIFLNKKSYSQCGEDVFINNFFKKKKYKGSYLDIGAFNPVKYSNTFLLYKKGWSGTNIDLNQTSIDLFNIFRSRDKNICAAISDKENKVKVSIENIFSPLNTISLNPSSAKSVCHSITPRHNRNEIFLWEPFLVSLVSQYSNTSSNVVLGKSESCPVLSHIIHSISSFSISSKTQERTEPGWIFN